MTYIDEKCRMKVDRDKVFSEQSNLSVAKAKAYILK